MALAREPMWICFDLGGILLEILHNMEERLALCDADARGLVLPNNVLPELTRLNMDYQRGTASWPEIRLQLFDVTGGFGFTEADWDKIEKGIIVGAKPDAQEVVDLCKAGGYELGVLSNTCELHVQQFESLSFFDQIPVANRVYSHREQILKPEMSAYRCFENRVGAEPASILFFDDTTENILAARELGWNTFHVPRGEPVLPHFERALASFG